MLFLKADTAVEVLIGPVVAVGDGFTPVTTMTIAAADEAELIKHNGSTALVVAAITGTVAAITSADGHYTLDLGTGDVDTEGFLVVLINDDSLMLPIRHEFMVVNANVYDALFAAAATDLLQVDVREFVDEVAPAPAATGVPDVNLTHHVDVVASVTGGNLDVHAAAILAAVQAAIARLVNPQANQALPNITFEMYDSTTHNPKAGLTVTGEVSLDAGAYAAVSGTIAEISDGTYQFDADAADMNGALITFRFSEGTADDTFVHVKTAA